MQSSGAGVSISNSDLKLRAQSLLSCFVECMVDFIEPDITRTITPPGRKSGPGFAGCWGGGGLGLFVPFIQASTLRRGTSPVPDGPLPHRLSSAFSWAPRAETEGILGHATVMQMLVSILGEEVPGRGYCSTA